MKTTQKIVLSISSIYIIYFLLLVLVSSQCHSAWCKVREDDPFGVILFALMPLAPLFLLSLVTYKMRDEVFRAWWGFARWWVPVIILVTYLLSTQSGGSGMGIGGAMSSAVDAIILGFFYAVLIIVSLWRIVRKYRQLKREGAVNI